MRIRQRDDLYYSTVYYRYWCRYSAGITAAGRQAT
jgi:hypothetical protein